MKENDNNNGRSPRHRQNYQAMIITLIFAVFLVGFVHNWWTSSRSHEIPYSEFNQMLKEKQVESVTVTSSKIKVTPKKGYLPKTEGDESGSTFTYLGTEYYVVPMNDPNDPSQLFDREKAERFKASGRIILEPGQTLDLEPMA